MTSYLKIYKEIGEKIRSKLSKEFAKEPTYEFNRYTYINTKIREYGGVTITIFINIKYQKYHIKIFQINVYR